MRTLLIICGLLYLFCCSGQKTKSDELEELRYNLPLLETPLGLPQYIVETRPIDLSTNSIINSLQKQFELRDIRFQLYGKIYDTDKYLAILGSANSSMGAPIIIVLDNDGGIIDSLTVYPKHDDTFIKENKLKESYNFAYLYPDQQIVTLDSTVFLDIKMVNGKPTELPETQEFSVLTRKFKISDKGKIENFD